MNFKECLFSDFVQLYDDDNNLVIAVWKGPDGKQHMCVGESFDKVYYAGFVRERNEEKACQLLDFKYEDFLQKPEEDKPVAIYDTLSFWVNCSLYTKLIDRINNELVKEHDREFRADPSKYLDDSLKESTQKRNCSTSESFFDHIYKRCIFMQGGKLRDDGEEKLLHMKDRNIPYFHYLQDLHVTDKNDLSIFKGNLWRCDSHSVTRLLDPENGLCLVTWATSDTKFHMCVGESFDKMIYVGFLVEEFSEHRYRKFQSLYRESVKNFTGGYIDKSLLDTDGYWMYKVYTIERDQHFEENFETFFSTAQEKALKKGLYKTPEELMIDYNKTIVIGHSLETV